MLITFEEIYHILSLNNMSINGVFHIGAHECEELSLYDSLGIKPEDIIWIDAINSKVIEATDKGIPNVYHATITNTDDEDIVFNAVSYTHLTLPTIYSV